LRPAPVVEGVPAGSGDELADPAGIGLAARILGSESFVDVVVAVDDDVDPGGYVASWVNASRLSVW